MQHKIFNKNICLLLSTIPCLTIYKIFGFCIDNGLNFLIIRIVWQLSVIFPIFEWLSDNSIKTHVIQTQFRGYIVNCQTVLTPSPQHSGNAVSYQRATHAHARTHTYTHTHENIIIIYYIRIMYTPHIYDIYHYTLHSTNK